MFKASNLGSVEGMECFSLAGDADLRRYLIDHLDTVQLAAVSGMPQGDAMVSKSAKGANLTLRLRVPSPYCKDKLMQRELNYDQWQRAINGDFEFLDGDLMPESLKLLVGNPAFFHTRITQFRRLYLYTFSKETRIVLRECFAAYQKRAGKDAAPMDPIFMREDLCLMLRRKENDEFVLSCVSDDQELLLGTYAEKELFPAEDESETTESILWRKFNEYMRDTYGVKVSSVMVLKFGSKLRVK